MAEKRKNHVAARIDIVNGDEQLAKTRLSKIVGQQFHVPARQIVGIRRGDRRRATNQVPQLRQ